MKKSELRQIIKEEIQGYSKYIGKTKGLTSDELSQILTKIALGDEEEYTVEYWYRYDDNEKDWDEIKVKAHSESKAIEKAKQQARKGAIPSTFKIKK